MTPTRKENTNCWQFGEQWVYLPAAIASPEDASAWFTLHGNELEPGYVPPPIPARVHAERDRRLSLGFDFDFGDERGVHRIGTTEADMRGWDEVTKAFQAADRLGHALRLMVMTDTGAVEVDSTDWARVLLQAAQVRQAIWRASFVLQAMNPIPDDYADDQYWNDPAA